MAVAPHPGRLEVLHAGELRIQPLDGLRLELLLLADDLGRHDALDDDGAHDHDDPDDRAATATAPAPAGAATAASPASSSTHALGT